MITGAHTILYAEDADAARGFFRDVLKLPHVDVGDGWLIFALPPGELGVHPTEPGTQGHELFLTCADIRATVQDLRSKGVEIMGDITDEGWGLLATLKVPGGGVMGLYEPRHQTAFGANASAPPDEGCSDAKP